MNARPSHATFSESNPSPGAPPTQPGRRAIATFSNYGEAERAVDRLSDLNFPVERTAIVGSDMRLVEQVGGRLTWMKAMLRGAVSSAIVGALIGWFFGLWNWIDALIASLMLALYGLLFGAVVGAIFGLLLYLLQGGRRDFYSTSALQPSRYELVVDAEVADEAARLLA